MSNGCSGIKPATEVNANTVFAPVGKCLITMKELNLNFLRINTSQAKVLIFILPLMALVAIIFGFQSNSQSDELKSRSSEVVLSNGPACNAYFESVETYAEAYDPDPTPECKAEIETNSSKRKDLEAESSSLSQRANLLFIVGILALLAAAGVWLRLRAQAKNRE